MYTRAGDLLCRPVLCCAARERRSLPPFRRRGFLGLPLSERWSLPGPAPAGGPTSCAPKKSAEEGLRLGRPARAAPGARYARRPLAGAPPRAPGLSPLRGPGPMGRNSKRYLREYLASTRRLPPLPTGTPAEGSIQVADAPNGGNEMCGELAGQEPQLTCAQPSAHVQPAACSRPVPPAPAKRAAALSGGRFCMQLPGEGPWGRVADLPP